MASIRIIPRLDIKGPNLVKGIHLEGLRVLGKPEIFAEYYYEQGADELLYMDVVASLYERNSLQEIISKTAKKTFIPLTVGGGIRTLDDIRTALRAGADKVSLNTAAIKNPAFIKQASLKYGSSTIVVSIEVIRQPDGKYLAYTDNGREFTGIEAISWAQKVEELGAGEIIVTSVDREGAGKGFDLEITKKVSDAVSIPVIAHGGAGSHENILSIINEGKATAVCIASMLHYDAVEVLSKPSHEHHQDEGNTEFLKGSRIFNKVQKTNLKEIKSYLISNGIDCRH
jgi:cyclase